MTRIKLNLECVFFLIFHCIKKVNKSIPVYSLRAVADIHSTNRVECSKTDTQRVGSPVICGGVSHTSGHEATHPQKDKDGTRGFASLTTRFATKCRRACLQVNQLPNLMLI